MAYALGLDFGTSFTAAAVHDGATLRAVSLGTTGAAVPAVVFVRDDGTLVHGEDAWRLGASAPGRLVGNVKRRLGESTRIRIDDREIHPEELVAAHLRWAVERVVERLGGWPDGVVLTYPASWRRGRVEAFGSAVEGAGLGEALLLAEPTAAALLHAETHPLAVGDLVAAYDFGGGSFDAAVLRRTRSGFDLVGTPLGDEYLGGVDFDDAVRHIVQTKLGDAWSVVRGRDDQQFRRDEEALRRDCVAVKEALSEADETELLVSLPGFSGTVVVTRAELEPLLQTGATESVGTFRRAVESAGAGLGDLAAVLLVGGSTRIPLIRREVTAALPPHVAVLAGDPKHAVARGAALLAVESAGSFTPGPARGATGAPTAAVAPGWAGRSAVGEPVAPVVAAAPAPPATDPPPVAARSAPPTGAVAPPGRPEGPGPSAGAVRRRPGRRLVVAGSALVLVAVASGAAWWAAGGDDSTTTSPAAGGAAPSTSATTAAPGTVAPDTAAAETAEPTTTTTEGGEPVGTVPEVRAASAAGMVEIPAGSYTVGTETPQLDAARSRTVEVERFFIDTFEVTNGQYARFLQALVAPAPLGWVDGRVPDGTDDFAVTGVEWVWAQTFCLAQDKRLPSDAEWEVAARGPDGSLLPGGATEAELGVDVPGPRPVGAVAANVSGFGVHDAVAGVWEWVDDPYDAIEPGQRVRRGGEYGFVRGGAATRQQVDAASSGVVSETGFRCAADRVDPSVPPGQFSAQHDPPAAVDQEDDGPQEVEVASGSVLVEDTFDDLGAGWPEEDADTYRVGYHAPWYHLEASTVGAQVMALKGVRFSDGAVETSVFIDSAASPGGRFRYGLVFRAQSELEALPAGVPGPARPAVYYAFVIDPRGGTWQLLHEDELPQRPVASGALPPDVVGRDLSAPILLRVEMDGADIGLFVDGTEVQRFDTKGFHLVESDLGFYAESISEPRVHVHFDDFRIFAP